jgi:predicted phage terminase large subunit-like protein
MSNAASRTALLDAVQELTPEEFSQLTQEELEAIHRAESEERLEGESLLDFVPRITPRFMRPGHLARVADAIERARRGERVRALVSAPPRHAKTELLLHGIPYYLGSNPSDSVAYVSYGAQFAHGKSRLARGYAHEAGFSFHPDFNTVAEWRNTSGGGCVATGIDGPLTGKGFNLALVDDPHKDRIEAESPLARDRVEEWFRGTLLTRMEPGGSVLVFMQRWHDDDLVGRLLKDADTPWEYIALEAIDDEMVSPLWPERWSPADLASLRNEVGEYNWWSQYKSKPRPRGGKVFQRDPVRYLEPAIEGARIILSLDGAGTEDTRADHTAAMALACTGARDQLRVDIIECWRDQLTPEHAAPHVLAFQQRNGGGEFLIESTRDGKAIAAALRKIEPRIRIRFVPPIGDKFIRAQPGAAAWNQGRVRVPMHAPWVPAMLTEFEKFTGVGSRKDDQVDAFSQGFNEAMNQVPSLSALDKFRSRLPRPRM